MQLHGKIRQKQEQEFKVKQQEKQQKLLSWRKKFPNIVAASEVNYQNDDCMIQLW